MRKKIREFNLTLTLIEGGKSRPLPWQRRLNIENILVTLVKFGVYLMFQDFDTPITSFLAVPDEKRLGSSKGNQTNAPIINTNESQTSELRGVEVQTEIQIITTGHNKIERSYEAEKLGLFLKKILPKLEEELAESRDFTDKCSKKENNELEVEINKDAGFNLKPVYLEQELLGVNYNNDDKRKILLTQRCFLQWLPLSPPFQDNMISSLTWSSNSAILAVAFSKLLHEGWCIHESSVCLYNVDKHTSREMIKTLSCVRQVQFHPYFPVVLAAGFHNGEIALWNLSEDEHVSITLEKDSDELHDNAIEYLVWKEDRKGVKLVSGSRDGKIIFWKVTLGNLTFKPEHKFIIVTKENSLRLIDGLGETLEVKSISFWKDNENDFVIAACNKILRCSIKAAKILIPKSNFRDPIIMQYQGHEGLATTVSCLPSSDIFASGGIDGKIHIYRLNQVVPLYVINSDESVRGLVWNKGTCLVTWGTSSNVKSYRFDMKSMSVTWSGSQIVDGNISAIAFDSKRPGKVAIGRKTAGLMLINDFNLHPCKIHLMR